MQRPSQLQRVRELARSRELELAREVSELKHRQENEEVTLTRLSHYLEEYAGAVAQGARQVHDIDNERRFVTRLDKAVRQQRLALERASERMADATQRWYRARAEVEVITRLIGSREEKQQRELQRRIQRDADAHRPLRRASLPEVFQ